MRDRTEAAVPYRAQGAVVHVVRGASPVNARGARGAEVAPERPGKIGHHSSLLKTDRALSLNSGWFKKRTAIRQTRLNREAHRILAPLL